ncbi:MAG: FAD-dependent thymidylate synthase [Candidatus Nomurabacteria bacterium]|nr:MAG: FAD-dependent thymidylate synthase [Candidatus Nomurabacteria bacterium]
MNNEPTPYESGGQKGLFIVIEGTDGSGKSTQYKKLRKHLADSGYEVVDMHFPRYKEDSSYFVRQYLAGKYGSSDDVGPFTGSLFYALDRYQASNEIRNALSEGKIVLCDRFVGSNMAHQGTKFSNAEERRGYFIWLDNIEFITLGIPRPDLNFVLNTPLDIIVRRLNAKKQSSEAIQKDIHETNENHISKSIEVYKDLCNLFPKDFQRIDSSRGNEELTVDEIHNLIWEKVTPMLQPIKKDFDDTDKVLEKTDLGIIITDAGKRLLSESITNTDGNVYAFNENISPVTVAAAMARLSRRGDDMRVTLLDEFINKADKDKGLLKRVITAYGDDSVQQLVGQHVVVENASNLLTKKLEWGRLASYLEQSTRYIYFDQKDQNGNYRYHIPEYFDDKTKSQYISSLDSIFDLYSTIVHRLTDYVREKSSIPPESRDIAWKGATRAQACDAARPLLPVATTSTVGIFASGQALESLIMHLLSDELPEARNVGQQILEESRKVIPTFLERADKPDRGGATIAYMSNTKRSVKTLVSSLLQDSYSNDHRSVTLSNYWPKNELDVIPQMIYEHSNLSLHEIKHQINNLDYNQRCDIFNAYIGERLNRRHRPGRALEIPHYSWDIVCDYGIFRDLQRHRIVDDLQWQSLTPRFGYDIPELIESAGLVDLFEKCFSISLELFSLLQANNYATEAQYATLLGHKMRWKVTYNAREAFHLHELRTSPQGHPGYRKLVKEMHDKLCEVHPMLGQAMKFINQDEDPELTRLASERYTQFKLQQIDK